jgi:hypothetical protein
MISFHLLITMTVSAVTLMLAHCILSHILYSILVGKGLYFNTKIVNNNNLNLC